MFEHVKLPELDFDLKAQTTESGRTYLTPSGKSYPSITTVLSSYNKKAIMEWRQRVGDAAANKISSQAAGRGTKMHTVCEKYLLNEDHLAKAMPDAKEMFLKIRPQIDANIGKVYALEQALYSDKLRLAGRVDCIAEWNGKLSIIDYKTSTRYKDESKILNYFMQCSAYAEMFEERTGMPIEDVVVLVSVVEGDHQVFARKKFEYLPQLNTYIERYWNK